MHQMLGRPAAVSPSALCSTMTPVRMRWARSPDCISYGKHSQFHVESKNGWNSWHSAGFYASAQHPMICTRCARYEMKVMARPYQHLRRRRLLRPGPIIVECPALAPVERRRATAQTEVEHQPCVAEENCTKFVYVGLTAIGTDPTPMEPSSANFPFMRHQIMDWSLRFPEDEQR